MKRIYVVECTYGQTLGNGITLVDATSAAQAVRHATKNYYKVRVATARDMAKLAPDHKVEDAGGVEE